MSRKLIALILASLLALPLAAQQSAPLVERIDVNVVNVDVVVTDKQGNVVRGLTRDDFEILENNQVRPISNFYEAGAAKTPGSQLEFEHPRRIIFFVDNSSLSQERRNRLLEDMKQFASQTLREGDEAMVVSYGPPLIIRTQFTSDPERIARAFSNVKAELPRGELVYRTAIETELAVVQAKATSERITIARQYADERLGALKSSVEAINALMKNVAGVDGKKALVFASESFPIHPGREIFEAIDRNSPQYDQPKIASRAIQGMAPPPSAPATTGSAPQSFGKATMGSENTNMGFESAGLEMRPYDASKIVDTVGRTANASGVTLYPLHAGVAGPGDETSADRSRSGRTSKVALSLRANSEQAMQLIADLSGGVAATKTGGYAESLARIGRDLDSYYSLGFRAAEGTGTRNIQVKLRNKRGLQLRARRNYEAKSADVAMKERVTANLFARAEGNDLPILVQAGKPVPQGEGKLRVPIQVRIPLESLLLQKNGDAHVGAVDVYVVAANANGGMSDVVKRTENISAKSATGYHTYSMTLMMEPGARVSVGVFDHATRASGFGRYEVDTE